jgi:tetratricopeptide (TPR) repeat protein
MERGYWWRILRNNRPAGARFDKGSTMKYYWIGLCLWLVVMPLQAQTTGEPKCSDIAPLTALPTYYIGLGNVYFDRGDYTRAIIAYTCGIQLNPAYAPAYVSRGYAQAAQLNFEQAQADYEKALALDGNLVTAYNNFGLLYASEGNFGLALSQLNLAVALAPQNPALYTNRGIVHAIEGNYDLALADFEQALALNPDYAPAHAALGATYSAMATASYARYQEIVGAGVALPGLTPQNVLTTQLERSITGDFSIWLAFMIPTR